MAQPPAYNPATDFSDEERDNVGGRSTVRTAALDAELTSIATSINAIRGNLYLIQRDDGNLRDAVVKLFTLAPDVLNLLVAQGDATVRGPWLTATAYDIKDIVTENGSTYLAATAHVSGVFATDLAAGRWVLIAGVAPTASSIPFTPTATIAATNVQAAIDEADTENRAASAAVATAVTNLIAALADATLPTVGADLIGFDGGTTVGARLRTLATGNIYYASKLGFTTGGVVDNSAAFLAAKVALPEGATLRLDGLYRIASKLTWDKRISLVCEGFENGIYVDVGTSSDGVELIGTVQGLLDGLNGLDMSLNVYGPTNACQTAVVATRIDRSTVYLNIRAGALAFALRARGCLINRWNVQSTGNYSPPISLPFGFQANHMAVENYGVPIANPPLLAKGTVSVSNASPAVVSLVGHGLAIGDSFIFTSAPPAPLVAFTVYFVIAAGFNANSFQFSATLGGAALNTTAAGTPTLSACAATPQAVSVSNASPAVVTLNAHGLAINDAIAFTSAPPTPLVEGKPYFIISAGFGANSFRISETPGGSAVNTSAAGMPTMVMAAPVASNTNDFYVNLEGGTGVGVTQVAMPGEGSNTYRGEIEGLSAGVPLFIEAALGPRVMDLNMEANAAQSTFKNIENLHIGPGVVNLTSAAAKFELQSCQGWKVDGYKGALTVDANCTYGSLGRVDAPDVGDTVINDKSAVQFAPISNSTFRTTAGDGGGFPTMSPLFANSLLDIYGATNPTVGPPIGCTTRGGAYVAGALVRETGVTFPGSPIAVSVKGITQGTDILNGIQFAPDTQPCRDGEWVSLAVAVYCLNNAARAEVYIFDGVSYHGLGNVETINEWVVVRGGCKLIAGNNWNVTVAFSNLAGTYPNGFQYYVGGINVVKGAIPPQSIDDSYKRHSNVILSVVAPPAYAPAFEGQLYRASSTGKWYLANGTASSANWDIIN